MIEIIKRVEGERHQKTQLTGDGAQVSFNDYGHLCVRIIQPSDHAIDETPRDTDTLIVFDKRVSRKIKEFCQEQLTANKRSSNNNDLPF